MVVLAGKDDHQLQQAINLLKGLQIVQGKKPEAGRPEPKP